MNRRSVSVFVALCLTLAACGGGSDESAGSTTTNDDASSTTTALDSDATSTTSGATSTTDVGSTTTRASTSSTTSTTSTTSTSSNRSTTTTIAGGGGAAATTVAATSPVPPTAPPASGSLYGALTAYFYGLLADASVADGVTYVADEDCLARILGQYSAADAAIILATPYDEDPQLSDAGEALSASLSSCIDVDDPNDPTPTGSTVPATTAVPNPSVPIQEQAGDTMVTAFRRGVADGEFASIDEPCVRAVAARLSDQDATKVVTFGIENDPGLSDEGLDIFFEVFDCLEF